MESIFIAGLQDLLLRAALFAVGFAVAVHFTCMACTTDGPSLPWPDALLIAFTATSGFASCIYALIAGHHGPLVAAIIMGGMLVAFALRLWALGFHVSDFYKQRICAIGERN